MKLTNRFVCQTFATHEESDSYGMVEVQIKMVTTLEADQDPAKFYADLRRIIASRQIELGMPDADNS